MHEMEERAANSDQVNTLQSSLDSVTTELADVSSKLREAAVQLSKEKARNKAVVEHSSVSYCADSFNSFFCRVSRTLAIFKNKFLLCISCNKQKSVYILQYTVT